MGHAMAHSIHWHRAMERRGPSGLDIRVRGRSGLDVEVAARFEAGLHLVRVRVRD